MHQDEIIVTVDGNRLEYEKDYIIDGETVTFLRYFSGTVEVTGFVTVKNRRELALPEPAVNKPWYQQFNNKKPRRR